MAALRLSPIALRPAVAAAPFSDSSSPARVSCLLRRLPSAAPCRLRILSPFPRRHRGGGALGAVMMDSAASSYATALAEVAHSNDSLEKTAADVEKLEQAFADPAIESFFSNPTIPVERKAEVVKEIASTLELLPHTANFLNILVDMRRIDIFNEIAKEFELQFNKITNTEVAVVSSVVDLESQDLSQITKVVQQFTGAKNVRIKTVLDPSLIAGFTIRYGATGSKFIDMSVKKQIDEIATQLDFSSISF
ncbi:ATP synthase subunit delta, chloroplastic-like [Zingiber officinale]|uniref:Uncharacterized protein n=1 Tax=Zingiber officinale TaxID=94328 RepID=A0A8J5G3K1_ZINOF|nr:ATP synthase subunit delta, chloroplastic-like [Zingiber officinale]KAG6499815.1 hypothetical protein ZIOFF_039607 [Zingiber officinale]